jgi:hypothetical protein
MLRCDFLAVSVAVVCLVVTRPGHAQAMRKFPATALRGEISITQPPALDLNEQPARLAPGARIRGADNLLVLSGALVGRRLMVHYTLDPMGQLLDVWLLTPEEQARKPWPVTSEQAASGSFDPDSQTWTLP